MIDSLLIWCLSWALYLYGFTMFKTVDEGTAKYTENLIAKRHHKSDDNSSSQILEPVHFYVEDIQKSRDYFKMAQDLIKESTPIKLTFRNESNVFNDYNYYLNDDDDDNIYKNDNISKMITTLWVGFGDPLNRDFTVFAGNLINEYPVSLLKFTGNYIAGGSHSDASISGCYNFYYLKNGEKKVTLLPPSSGNYIDLYYDKHSMIPKDELYDIDNHKWLQYIPLYYQFKLKKNEIIIFNNCDSIHHFQSINIHKNGYPMVYSLRFTNSNREKSDIARSNYHYTIKSKEFATVMIDQLWQGTIIRTYRAR